MNGNEFLRPRAIELMTLDYYPGRSFRSALASHPITSRAAWPAWWEPPRRDRRAMGAADSALSSRL